MSFLKKAAPLIVIASAVVTGCSEQEADNNSSVESSAAETEKCYGVTKAGHNDCAGETVKCSGHSTEDGQADAWIALPKGLCDKLAVSNLKG